jgi:hypothetical protein
MIPLLSQVVYLRRLDVNTCEAICLARSNRSGHSGLGSTHCLVWRTEAETNDARVRDEAPKGFFVWIRKD